MPVGFPGDRGRRDYGPPPPDDIDTLVAFTLSEALDAERRTLIRADVQRGVAGAFATPPKARYWVVESGGHARGRQRVGRHRVEQLPRRRLLVDPEPLHRARAPRPRPGRPDPAAPGREAKAGGALDLRLYGYNTNARALRAYQRFGFREAPYLILTKSLIGE